MAEGGGSSSAAASSGEAASGEVGTGKSAEAVAGETTELGTKTAELAFKEGGKVSEKVGAVIDDKAVTVKDVKEKSTIDKDHVEGEEKVKKEEVKKHKYADRLAKEYPDRQFENDEDYENTHEEYVKNLEGYRERGTIANQKLVALFEAEPQIADVITAMIGGATLRSALARHIGAEDLVPEEGDPDHSVYEKNKQERLERIEKDKKFNQEFNENVEFSAKSITEFADENKLKPEEAEKILGEFDDMLKDIYRGRITKETLTKIMRAVKHDEAVQEAKEEAKIEGRNEAIKEKITKEKEEAKDDGMPVLKKAGDTIEETEQKPEQVQIIDRIFDGAKKRSNF